MADNFPEGFYEFRLGDSAVGYRFSSKEMFIDPIFALSVVIEADVGLVKQVEAYFVLPEHLAGSEDAGHNVQSFLEGYGSQIGQSVGDLLYNY